MEDKGKDGRKQKERSGEWREYLVVRRDNQRQSIEKAERGIEGKWASHEIEEGIR